MVEEAEAGAKKERVSRVASWVVGAEFGGGGGKVEGMKWLMDQRTMVCSLAALERMRSPYQETLDLLDTE